MGLYSMLLKGEQLFAQGYLHWSIENPKSWGSSQSLADWGSGSPCIDAIYTMELDKSNLGEHTQGLSQANSRRKENLRRLKLVR